MAMGHHGPAIHGLADKIQRVFPQKSPKGQVEDPKASASMISVTRVRTILVNGSLENHTIQSKGYQEGSNSLRQPTSASKTLASNQLLECRSSFKQILRDSFSAP